MRTHRDDEDRFLRDVRIICLAIPALFAAVGTALAFTVAPGAINMAAAGVLGLLAVAAFQITGAVRRMLKHDKRDAT